MHFLLELLFYFIVLFLVSFDNKKKKKPNHFILSPRQYSARLYILQPWGEFLLASWPACLQLTDVTYSRAEKVSREVLIS